MRTDIQEALERFVQQRVPLGDFLTAVLENDLMGAMGRADTDNLQNLPAICAYVYNEMPSPCHGSRAKVEAWLSKATQSA